ncbi:MAG: sulfite exporter TauE/SafE family protein [Candidatus Methylacidiphilales bacterium]
MILISSLTAGLVTSIHCIGMCGPLACSVCPRSQDSPAGWNLLGYHGGRLISYSLLGALLGGIGSSLKGMIPESLPPLLPWAFILLFVLIFLGWEKKWVPPDWFGLEWLRRRLPFSHHTKSSSWVAWMLGLGTPLLPCGPLYLMFGLALLSGSTWQGLIILSAFCLGTAPLLLGFQLGFLRWQHWLTADRLRTLQRGLAFITLIFMVWRVSAGEPLTFSTEATSRCPMCP